MRTSREYVAGRGTSHFNMRRLLIDNIKKSFLCKHANLVQYVYNLFFNRGIMTSIQHILIIALVGKRKSMWHLHKFTLVQYSLIGIQPAKFIAAH